jgi:hypothetical protein
LKRRLLVLRAGSPSGNNLIRGLKADGRSLVVGCNDDPFVLKKSAADRNYLIPQLSSREFASRLRHVIGKERIGLVIPNTDHDVLAISRLAGSLPCRTYLPRPSAIKRCQDKYELTSFLGRRGFAVPETHAVKSLAQVDRIFRRLSSRSRLWCRVRRGAGSLAALPVENAEQARSWIRYWQDMRGVPPGSFTLSEYLPGRDLMVQCLFKNGKAIIAKMFERLSYHTTNGTPSGVSSIAGVSKMVFEPGVVQTCIKAMLALDPRASCVFFADLKENAAGEACFTEINAGRFSNMPTIHDLTARDSMCRTYVYAAFNESIRMHKGWGYAEDCYVMRERDALPVVLRAGDLFEGFDDAR